MYQNLASSLTGVTGYSFLVFNLLCGLAYVIALMASQFGNAFTGNGSVLGHRSSGCLCLY